MSRVYYTPSPCRDCKDRTVGCHSVCDKYIHWKDDSSEEPRPQTFEELKHRKSKGGRKICAEVD